MTRRRDVERRLASLSEIRTILDAMRNLALLETRKIERLLQTHRRSLRTTAEALADLGAYFATPLVPALRIPVIVLVGSERGLCGDFNETVLRALQERRASGAGKPVLVAIGSRLVSRLEADPGLALAHAGPSIAEDVDGLLPRLARELEGILRERRAEAFDLEVLCHESGDAGVRRTSLSPLPERPSPAPRRPPPAINLAPADLLAELAERYLVARLQDLLYGSLLAENEHRLRHMDAALRRLDENSAGLRARRNRLRQEEITEEIEIIMLSTNTARPGLAPGAAGVLREAAAEGP